MGELRRRSRYPQRLEREAALPVPRMGLGFLVGAGISLLVLASAADGMMWRYSEEREEVRARAALAESEVRALRDKVTALERENEALRELHREAFAPQPVSAIGERGGVPPPCQR